MLKGALLILQSFQVVIPRVVKFMGGNISRISCLKNYRSEKDVMTFSFPYMKGTSKICPILSLSAY